ncbi:hypothetical protein E2C01_016604 [Portunus trituberculatus]|uniref:Uncharacterized protein n=1 Tax=Portunus trituberculatus TaxID=210409 RepID=A0A5B7DR49_PORTR|nr:hypothetical protein [Portunus trituberculatus]
MEFISMLCCTSVELSGTKEKISGAKDLDVQARRRHPGTGTTYTISLLHIYARALHIVTDTRHHPASPCIPHAGQWRSLARGTIMVQTRSKLCPSRDALSTQNNKLHLKRRNMDGQGRGEALHQIPTQIVNKMTAFTFPTRIITTVSRRWRKAPVSLRANTNTGAMTCGTSSCFTSSSAPRCHLYTGETHRHMGGRGIQGARGVEALVGGAADTTGCPGGQGDSLHAHASFTHV